MIHYSWILVIFQCWFPLRSTLHHCKGQNDVNQLTTISGENENYTPYMSVINIVIYSSQRILRHFGNDTIKLLEISATYLRYCMSTTSRRYAGSRIRYKSAVYLPLYQNHTMESNNSASEGKENEGNFHPNCRILTTDPKQYNICYFFWAIAVKRQMKNKRTLVIRWFQIANGHDSRH